MPTVLLSLVIAILCVGGIIQIIGMVNENLNLIWGGLVLDSLSFLLLIFIVFRIQRRNKAFREVRHLIRRREIYDFPRVSSSRIAKEWKEALKVK